MTHAFLGTHSREHTPRTEDVPLSIQVLTNATSMATHGAEQSTATVTASTSKKPDSSYTATSSILLFVPASTTSVVIDLSMLNLETYFINIGGYNEMILSDGHHDATGRVYVDGSNFGAITNVTVN